MSRVPRGLWYAAAASAGLHLAFVAGRLPGSAMTPHDAAAPAVLITRLIASSRSQPEPQTASLPEPSAQTPLPPDASVVAAITSPVATPSPATVPVPVPAPPMPQIAEPAPLALPPAAGGPAEPRGVVGDRGPQLLDDIDATLPPGAGGRGGSVTVKLTISEQGTIEKVQILRSSPPGLLDEAALAALAKVHFAPGLRGGLPVRSDVVYEIDFAAIAKGTDTSGRSY